MKKLKRMVFGEKMPDKDDPKYRARYERDVEAGRRFCHATRLDKCAAGVQNFATRHSRLFFSLVITVIVMCFAFSLHRMCGAWHHRSETTTAAEAQRTMIEMRQDMQENATDCETQE